MKRLLIIAALFAAACQPMPDTTAEVDTTDVPPAVSVPENPTRAISSLTAPECAARGGRMVPQGRMQTSLCLVTYADAGRQCRDSDDCEGGCRVPDSAGQTEAGQRVVGQCEVNSGTFGCFTRVEDGKAEPTICVD